MADAVGKSEIEIRGSLEELIGKGAAQWAADGVLEIQDRFWPYERAGRCEASGRAGYIAEVKNTAMRGSLMLVPLSGSLHARGTEMEIATSLDPSIRTIVWTADSRELIASVGYPESARLWRFRPSTGVAPRLLSFEGAEPAIASHGNRLVLSRHTVVCDIWSLELDDADRAAGPPVRAFDSSKNELTPKNSRRMAPSVAFGSNRSGFYEIWICRSNGSACDQVMKMKTYAGSPAWSRTATGSHSMMWEVSMS